MPDALVECAFDGRIELYEVTYGSWSKYYSDLSGQQQHFRPDPNGSLKVVVVGIDPSRYVGHYQSLDGFLRFLRVYFRAKIIEVVTA